MRRFSMGAKKRPSPRAIAVEKLLENMDGAVVGDDSDKESSDLHHFWKILLRGIEVKLPDKGGPNEFSVFWMDNKTLFLRKKKGVNAQSGQFRDKIMGPSMWLGDLCEVRYGRFADEGSTGFEDEEEQSEACLNKFVSLISKKGLVMEFEVTQRAAEMLVNKFNLIVSALNMYEKIESALLKSA